MSPFPPHAMSFPCLRLFMSYACHNYCKFTYANSLLGPKKKTTQFPWSHLQSLNSTIFYFLLLLQQGSLSLMGEEYHIAVPFMVGHSPIYYFFTSWPVESLCANCLLLQEEMSLMRVERHTDQYTPQEGSTRSFVSISRNNSSSFSPRLPDISSHRSLTLSIVKGMSSIS